MIILKNAFLIDKNAILDVKIENGIIVDISENIKGDGIDLNGQILSRGLIDMHCHLREPGYEYKETIETGINSAINGGYSCICPMANTKPVNDNIETLEFIKQKANGYNLFPICATTKNLEGKELTDIKSLKNKSAIAFSNDGKPIENQEVLAQALKTNELIISHSEIMSLNGSKESEFEAVKKEIETLRKTGGKLHFAHISTKESIELIRKAKKEGLNLTCETAPHYFSLIKTNENINNSIFKVNPPLRDNDDRIAIIEGLKDGTIDVIATDHAPHSLEEKQKDYKDAPMGLVGFETAIGLAFTYLKNHLSTEEILNKFTKNPAKILEIEDFGEIKIGNKANLTVINPNLKWIIKGENFKSKCKFTPFENMELTGKATMTIVNGEIYKND
ncbi:MAG: dihydroorotase [Candidatus Gastranaerophilales bacterium]|nr:dihydroorotase [Candidatus Gastranaerophilales bacterium]